MSEDPHTEPQGSTKPEAGERPRGLIEDGWAVMKGMGTVWKQTFRKDNTERYPEEIAPAYVFLAAPSCSSYITGEVLPIIGGYSGG